MAATTTRDFPSAFNGSMNMMKSFRLLFSLDSAGTFAHVGARLPQFNAGNPSSHPSDCSPIKAGDGRTGWSAEYPGNGCIVPASNSRDKAIKDGFMDFWRKQSSQGGREAEFHRCTISKSVSTGSSCTIQLDTPQTSAAADKYPSATSADRETLSGDFHVLNGRRPYIGMPDVSEKFPLRRLALIGHDTSEAERFDI